MDPKLSFANHIDYTKAKAQNMLAFVKRQCFKSFNVDTAKLLYCSLVRSILEFANIIWIPSHVIHKNAIESIQKNAVIFLHQDWKKSHENGFILSPYKTRCQEIDLTTLTRRRLNAAVLFMHKIISGRIASTNLRNELEINRGVRTIRNPEFIRIKRFKTDYGYDSPFNVACRAFNLAYLFIDPTLPFYEFKRKLINISDKAFASLANF